VVKKNDETKDKIRNRLKGSFMFGALDEKELEIVIDAMEEASVKAGTVVINEGEDGDDLFVVESGELDCHKKFPDAPEPKYLKTYQPGEAFGELALLYNAPRAATISAKTDCLMWKLDRNTFNHIVKDATAKKREQYEEFLKTVKVLQSMDHYERSKLADALKEETYQKGDYVIQEGQEGDIFYLILEGEAIATKTISPGQPPQEVMKYKRGDYFGELALLKNEPRAANVVAQTKLKVCALERDRFMRLLGPLDEILKRNMTAYMNYV
jgi:cAMP-dependent protein kinase regulator